MILVSVCITTFNRQESVIKAIDSVLNQTYKNLELIIVNDSSTDNTKMVIENYLSKTENTKIISNSYKKGLSACRNIGLKLSKGEYIVFLDDDDTLYKESIEKRINLMVSKGKEISNLAVVYSGCSIYNKDIGFTFYHKPIIKGRILNSIKKGILETIPSSGLFVKEKLLDIGAFDEKLKSFIDHDLWLNMAKNNFSSIYIDSPLTKTEIFSNKKSMVTNISERLEWIKLFIDKWSNFFNSIMGSRRTNIFFKEYRKKVIGELLIKTLYNYQYENFVKCFKYLNKHLTIFEIMAFIFIKSFKKIISPIYYFFKKHINL